MVVIIAVVVVNIVVIIMIIVILIIMSKGGLRNGGLRAASKTTRSHESQMKHQTVKLADRSSRPPSCGTSLSVPPSACAQTGRERPARWEPNVEVEQERLQGLQLMLAMQGDASSKHNNAYHNSDGTSHHTNRMHKNSCQP